jgi:hypothetical protein
MYYKAKEKSMSAKIPVNMEIKDLLKATGYDCPEDLQNKTFNEATSGSGGGSAVNLVEYEANAVELVNAKNSGTPILPPEGIDGFSQINADSLSLQERTITSNGTYEAGTSSAPYLFKKITVSVPATDTSTVETLQCYQNSDSGNCLYFNTKFSVSGIINTNQENQFFNVSSDGKKINGIAQTITENLGDRITNSGGTSYTRAKKLDVLISAPNKLLEVEFVKGNNVGIKSFNFVTNKAQNGTSYENYRFNNSNYYDGTTDCELVIYASAGGPPSAGYYRVKV